MKYIQAFLTALFIALGVTESNHPVHQSGDIAMGVWFFCMFLDTLITKSKK